MSRNITLYPWFRFCQNLIFWQAVWFLYFQQELSGAEAILLYVVYDITTTALEVPSGYMSDRLGRRVTLLAAAVSGGIGSAFLALGDSFAAFALGQICLGACAALTSGTDTSLLFESLKAAGRTDEVEQQELRGWRFGFSGLAVSAVLGGVIAMWSMAVPFALSGVAFAASLVIALQFREPPHSAPNPDILRIGTLKSALRNPVLIWLFCLSALMYVYSHLPFIFGQPFILQALNSLGLASEAPLVSGVVSALMMLLSVVVSLYAMRLRRRIGLPAILLFAFALQIGLIAVLAVTNSVLAIAFLFLRMVPDSLSQPFIQARIQPLLHSDTRATYLSLKSLVARLLLAGSLLLASGQASGNGALPYADMRVILAGYAVSGVLCVIALFWAARRVKIEPPAARQPEAETKQG